MKTVEIVMKETLNARDEGMEEARVIFIRPHKIKELMKDKGFIGELLRDHWEK